MSNHNFKNQKGFTPSEITKAGRNTINDYDWIMFVNPKNNTETEISERGFTLIELVVAFGILLAIVILAGIFSNNIINFGSVFSGSFIVEQETQQTFQTMTYEVRDMGPSSIGSYPIEEASSTSFTFYSDINNDGLFERIHYFLSGTTIKKGVLKPTGNPLVYNLANEVVSDQIHNIIATSTPIFSYYNSSYSGREPAMTFPISISNVTLVKVSITAKDPYKGEPYSYEIQLTPRNLRTNL